MCAQRCVDSLADTNQAYEGSVFKDSSVDVKPSRKTGFISHVVLEENSALVLCPPLFLSFLRLFFHSFMLLCIVQALIANFQNSSQLSWWLWGCLSPFVPHFRYLLFCQLPSGSRFKMRPLFCLIY